MTCLERIARVFRPQLPSLRYVPVQPIELAPNVLYAEVREVTWPRVPVLLVSGRMVRSGELPPRRWVKAARLCDGSGRHDRFYYAVQPVAALLFAAAWWDNHRWCLERWLARRGILVEPYEGCYFHELRWRWRR